MLSVLYSSSVQTEWKDINICCDYLVPPMVKFLFSGKKTCKFYDYSGNIILLLRGMSRISGCHDWLQQWQPVFISLPSVLAHARRSESVSSLEKTCVSPHTRPESASLLSPLNK